MPAPQPFRHSSARIRARRWCARVAALLVLAAPALLSAQAAPPSVPGMDAPELARLGSFAVGTQEIVIVSPARLRISAAGIAAGKLARADRKLLVRIWYPAAPAAGAPVSYPHLQARAGLPAIAFATPGIAVAGAAPLPGRRFPLVVVSHGYGGWNSFMSWLTENLASKGYVVAALDHQDPQADPAGFALAFGNVLLDRAQDQRAVLKYLLAQADAGKGLGAGGLGASIDSAHVGLVGYSMGGFGALATAGADYDPASPVLGTMPADAKAALLAADPALARRITALVAIAPWGGQPATRMWTPAALAAITMPVLLIDGDQDDIVDFKRGVSWIFNGLRASDRRLLVFHDARHNVGGNPLPAAAADDFALAEYFAEPVWRSDRINAINQHFITAFLDLTLKGDSAKAAYLDVPMPVAGDGDWPVGFREQLGGQVAGDAQPRYWRGFQRRWALGLELHHLTPGH